MKWRREYHQRVGEALEVLLQDRLEELAPMLAHHFAEALLLDRALKYYTLAGDVAFRLYANTEAIAHYSQAIEIALELDERGEGFIHLFRNRGRALELNGQFDEAIDNYQQMEDLGRDRGERELELAALTARAPVHATQTTKFDEAKARAYSNRALVLADELGDMAARSKIIWTKMLAQMFDLNNLGEAVRSGEESLSIARELGLQEQTAFSLSDLGWAYAGADQLNRASAALSQARPLWRQRGNLPMLANNLSISWMPA